MGCSLLDHRCSFIPLSRMPIDSIAMTANARMKHCLRVRHSMSTVAPSLIHHCHLQHATAQHINNSSSHRQAITSQTFHYVQGLKYNFQGGGTVQLSGPPSSLPGHVSIAGSQIINDRLNVLSMIFILFFLQFCKIL